MLVGSGRDARGVQVISAVLGTPSLAARDDATLKLLDWGRKRFRPVTVVDRGEELERVPIRYRRGAEMSLVAERTVRRVVPRGQRGNVEAVPVDVPEVVDGPIVAGQSFGSAEIRQNGRVVGKVALVAASSIAGADLEQKAESWFTGPIPILIAFALLAGTVMVARQLRRSLRAGGKARAA